MATDRREARRPNRRRRRRGARHGGGLPLALVFTVLVGINIYVFFFRGGTSIQDLMKVSAMKKQRPAAEAVSGPSAPGASSPAPLGSGPKVVHGSMRGHLGLSTAMAAFGVGRAEAAELIAALRPLLNMRTLAPAQRFDIVFDSRTGQVSRFTYHVSSTVRVVAERDAQGGITARRESPEAGSLGGP